MLSHLTTLLEQLKNSETHQKTPLSNDDLHLATAALLIEVATIDRQLDDVELRTLTQALESRFLLNDKDLMTLVDQAKMASKEASSLYQFTQLINQHCDDEQKYTLACELWAVAYADNVLDKHEEHIIRRICDLIHLRHSDFIRAKQTARDNHS